MNNLPNRNPNPRNLPNLNLDPNQNQNHNPPAIQFQRFHFTHAITVHVHIDRKIFFHQRIVFLFGPERLAKIMASSNPIILPLMDYSVSFNIVIYILF